MAGGLNAALNSGRTSLQTNQKAIEVVYGSDVQGRGIEESAPLGVKAAAASFNYGNLMAGMIAGYTEVQGFYYSPPLPVAEIEERFFSSRPGRQAAVG